MNCNDYLAMLSTLPVEELEYGSARAHATECRDCDRVTRVVVERERSMLVAYADLGSTAAASQVAANAFALSNRRRVAFYYKVALGIAALATVFVMVVSRRTLRLPGPEAMIAGAAVAEPPRMYTEVFELRCTSPEKAGAMLRTHLQGDARVTIRPSALPTFVTVEATRQQIRTAQDILDRLERSNEAGCMMPTGAAPAPP